MLSIKKHIRSLFSRKDKREQTKKTAPELELSLEEKINSAIQTCEQDKKHILSEIEEIQHWAQDAIIRSFTVNTKYWYKELNEYEQIKQSPENQTVSQQITTMCDEIVQGYRNQIRLREAKLKLCETICRQYHESISKIKETHLKEKEQTNDYQKIDVLKQHISRLSEMDEDISNMESSIFSTQKLQLVDLDMEHVEQDFLTSKEIYGQMEKLSALYSDFRLHNNSEVFQQEIELLIQQIKTKNTNSA